MSTEGELPKTLEFNQAQTMQEFLKTLSAVVAQVVEHPQARANINWRWVDKALTDHFVRLTANHFCKPDAGGKHKRLRHRMFTGTEKEDARAELWNAIKSGVVIKPKTCQACGHRKPSREIHGHHEDYSKPLHVRWICEQCHRNEHGELVVPRHPSRVHRVPA
jgi:hypothetical protein